MGQTRTIIVGVLIGAALLAPFIFPLFATIILALIAASVASLVPFAVGLILDALYWSHGAYPLPLASLVGLAVSVVVFFVHRFVETSIIQR